MIFLVDTNDLDYKIFDCKPFMCDYCLMDTNNCAFRIRRLL